MKDASSPCLSRVSKLDSNFVCAEEETVEAVDPHKQDSQDEHRQDQLEAPMASGEPPSTPTTAGHEPEATSPAASPAVPERHPGMGGHGMIAQGLDMLKEVSSPLPGPRAPIRVRLGSPSLGPGYSCFDQGSFGSHESLVCNYFLFLLYA